VIPTLYRKSIMMFLLFCLLPSSNPCCDPLGADGIAAPAFISAGTTPNLLILIDNSASMADLAHTGGDPGACYDGPETGKTGSGSFDASRTYGGYFKTDTWYIYNNANSRFEEIDGQNTCSGEGGRVFSRSSGVIQELCLRVVDDTVMFQANGNFMNWVSASRFDLSKQILTGGKFDPDTRTLISEGRGCSGNRFFKQIPVWDVDSGALNFLTFGVHAMDASHDPTTVIDLFLPNLNGFDAKVCRMATEAFYTAATPVETLATLLDQCTANDNVPAENFPCRASFKQSLLACRQWLERGFDQDPVALDHFMDQCPLEIPTGVPEYDDPLCVCDPATLVDFCETIHDPLVVDPTDRIDTAGRVDNLPAMLIEAGVKGQLGKPPLTMQGKIHDPHYVVTPPTGLVHEFADDLRMGVMQFNTDLDGGRVVVEIGDGTPDHIVRIAGQINSARAETWTPLAESVFNAIGYFTQRSDMRINTTDFETNQPPCSQWCQNNNLLVITDGAASADLHPKMTTFASVQGQNDGSVDDRQGCDSLQGSTFLDDISAYGFSGGNIFLEDPFDDRQHFQNIKTYFVVSGTPAGYGTGECSPKHLIAEAAANSGTQAPYFADDPQQLKNDLKTVFNVVRTGAASGAAASIFSAGRSGEGAFFQASFWPEVDGVADGQTVLWTGDVHALLIDETGNLYEDTDASHSLNDADQAVVIYYDIGIQESRACSQPPALDGTCDGVSKPLYEIDYLWSAAEWLADIQETDIGTNRSTYISDNRQRYIFTWNDLDNGGDVDHDEILVFEPRDDWGDDALWVTPDRAPVPIDFNVDSSAEVNRIIRWIRGRDEPGDPSLRSRGVTTPSNFTISGDPAAITWRLGDVVHATPTVVSRPAEGYHLLYDDLTYAAFVAAHTRRRHVIYFGGNDGMVHAVNGGFYDEKQKKFWRSFNENTGAFSDTGPALGAELWAYVPYNLLPHLKSLTEPGYHHRYYVDSKPKVFDVQIFESTPDSDGHVAGWGTILVIGMRLGGSRITAQEIMNRIDPGPDHLPDERVFSSAYMVFDISDPELPPRLLGELTYDPAYSVDLAYTLAPPAVVPVKTEEDGSDWFLVLGSGPTDVDGTSTQNAKIAVFPLKGFDYLPPAAFRIPSNTGYSHIDAGSFELTSSPHGFVSQIVTADFNVEPRYKADVVYFSTIEGGWSAWEGKMYRWVTDEACPQAWQNPKVMFEAGRPISAAPGIGYDGSFFWLYFGTGRFFSPIDKLEPSGDTPDYFFGIKEPIDAETGNFTWNRIDNAISKSKPISGNNAGERTLLRVDPIAVGESVSASHAGLECRDGSDCLPVGVTNFKGLKKYIVGTCDAVNGCSGTDGWVLELQADRERSLSQSALLGGLVTFTTYRPFSDVCKPEGEAYLYGVHYQTGTAYHETVFPGLSSAETASMNSNPSQQMVISRLSIGQGLAMAPSLHLGQRTGTKAFVQTCTGTIVEIPQSSLPVNSIKSGRLSWRSD